MLAPAHVRSTPFHVNDRTRVWMRGVCVAGALILAAFGFGFYRQLDWATGSWPLSAVRMTYIFLGAMAAAIAAPFAWTALRNELGALRAIAFAGAIGVPALGLYMFRLAADRDDSQFLVTGIAFIGIGAMWVAIYWWSGQIPLRDTRPLSGVLRASLAAFCGILVVVGGTLTLQVEEIFPWTIAPETSTVIGVIFLTAALLFGWIVAHPKWAYGELALTGFLAYDLVLFVPYLDLLRNRNDTATLSSYYGDPGYATVPGGDSINTTSLVVYLVILAISTIITIGMYVRGFARQADTHMALGD